MLPCHQVEVEGLRADGVHVVAERREALPLVEMNRPPVRPQHSEPHRRRLDRCRAVQDGSQQRPADPLSQEFAQHVDLLQLGRINLRQRSYRGRMLQLRVADAQTLVEG